MSDRSYDRLRHHSKAEKKRLQTIPAGEFWAQMRRAMYDSPAYRSLTLAARKVFERILIEHIDHGRLENGRLKVSYDDFVKYGLDRHAIRPALDELIALGFLECTTPGRRAYGPDPGWVATYRLTAFAVLGDDARPVSDEWARFSEEEVAQIQANLRAKRAVKKGRRQPDLSAATDELCTPETSTEVVIPFRKAAA